MGDVLDHTAVADGVFPRQIGSGGASLGPGALPQADDLGLSGLEVVALAAVARGVNAGDAGAHMVVHHDSPVYIDLAGDEEGQIGPGAHAEDDEVGVHGRAVGKGGGIAAVRPLADGGCAGVEAQLHALFPEIRLHPCGRAVQGGQGEDVGGLSLIHISRPA